MTIRQFMRSMQDALNDIELASGFIDEKNIVKSSMPDALLDEADHATDKDDVEKWSSFWL
ncbi:hypothetical protein V1522DRAFT_423531 [Lipomyces starkeyi]